MYLYMLPSVGQHASCQRWAGLEGYIPYPLSVSYFPYPLPISHSFMICNP